MTGAEIGSLIGTIGFPIAAAIFVAMFTKSRVEASEEASKRREEASIVRETKLGDRIDKLQDEIRQELVTVVNKATDAMVETRQSLEQCSGTLIAAAQIMQDMKDEANRRAKMGS